MKIAIVGSREFKAVDFAVDIIYDFLVPHEHEEHFLVVSGGAKGIDTLGENCAKKLGIEILIIKPNWEKYGKKAGFLRNIEIIKNADFILAFWDGKSKGTKHSIDLAIKAGKPVNIYVRT